MTSPFGDIFNKLKSSTKQAAEHMKLAGNIAALRVELTTQTAERDRVMKEIGLRTYSLYNRTGSLDSAILMEDIANELNHLERINKRIKELKADIALLQSELLNAGGEIIVDADLETADEDHKAPENR